MGDNVNTSRSQHMRKKLQIVIGFATVLGSSAVAAELKYRERFSRLLIDSAPGLLETFDAETGHFGRGVWICRDQDVMWPLAVIYTLDVPGNPYHRSPELLETLMKAGDALIADADPQGRWVFRKKDNSTWGMIHMPWTYSRWIRTFELIRDDMPPERRAAWEKALLNGYGNIAKTALGSVHNIPAHHAMGLYIAGKTLDRPAWREQAAEFLRKVAKSQSPNGYWSEGEGPVVNYNFVYVDALGTYYALSGDKAVLPALERASAFHRNFTYPDGNCVETIDQRNPFHAGVNQANLGFTFDPVGRTYLASQWAHVKDKEFKPDLLASLVRYGQEGPMEPADGQGARTYVLTEGDVERAMTLRQGPWFVCLSAFTSPVSRNRWYQDRQNLVSIFHDKTGLIIGGGNTKLQPAWSNFTVGDTSLLAHKPGDTNPNFVPAGELYHVPSQATLVREPVPGLDLKYGPQTCRIRVEIQDDQTLDLVVSTSTPGALPVAAHVTLLPRMGQEVRTVAGHAFKLGGDRVELTPEQIGGAIQYAGCTLRLPAEAGLCWPALPHNPYVLDGRAKPEEGRISLRLPFAPDRTEHRVSLKIGP